MTKTRTEVFIETSEILIIKQNRTSTWLWCEESGRKVIMPPLQEAALLMRQDVKTIDSMMENQHVHFCCLKPEIPRISPRSLCLF